jgi:cytochrome c-type protein NapC
MNKLLKRFLILGAALSVGGIIVILSWFVVATGLEETSDQNFCTSCHIMQPVAKAYLKDVHGGKSFHGVKLLVPHVI